MTAHRNQRRAMREDMATLAARKQANRARAKRVRDEGTQPPVKCKACGSTRPRGTDCALCPGDTQGPRTRDAAEVF